LDEKYVSVSFVRERWLGFLKDGTTNRQDLLASLGEPTGQYAGGRIFAYRLLLVEDEREKLAKARMLFKEADINDRREALAKKGRLLVYRREMKADLGLELFAREAEYSLVIVFDDRGTVSKSSLRRVLP
jgi:hypothetical protein